MKTKKLLTMSAAALVLCGALTACGGESSSNTGGAGTTEKPTEKVSLKVAVNSATYAKRAELEAAFEKDTGVDYDFEWQTLEEGDAGDKLGQDADKDPDVFNMADDQIGKLQLRGFLYQIPKDVLDKLNLSSTVLNTGKFAGKQYGIPYTVNTYFLYYNKSLLNAEEVKDMTTILEKYKNDSSKTGIAYDIGNGWYTQSLFNSLGISILEDPTGETANIYNEEKLSAEHNAKALEVANLMHMFSTYNGTGFTAGGEAEEGNFTSGKIASLIYGAWDYDKLKNGDGEDTAGLGDNLGVAVLPKLTLSDGSKVQMQSVNSHKQYGVRSTTAHPDESLKLVSWLGGEKGQEWKFDNLHVTPADTKVAAMEKVKQDPISAKLKEVIELEDGTFMQAKYAKFSNWWAATGSFKDACFAATATEESMKAALKALDIAVNAEIK